MRSQNLASPAVVASLNAANARSQARQDARDAARELPFGQVDATDDTDTDWGILELAD